jgi:hypothetical protein
MSRPLNCQLAHVDDLIWSVAFGAPALGHQKPKVPTKLPLKSDPLRCSAGPSTRIYAGYVWIDKCARANPPRQGPRGP